MLVDAFNRTVIGNDNGKVIDLPARTKFSHSFATPVTRSPLDNVLRRHATFEAGSSSTAVQAATAARAHQLCDEWRYAVMTHFKQRSKQNTWLSYKLNKIESQLHNIEKELAVSSKNQAEDVEKMRKQLISIRDNKYREVLQDY